MFDIDEFIAACVAARSESDSIVAVREVLDRALSEPNAIAEVLPVTGAEFKLLYSSTELSILKFVGPGMSIPPHEHLV